MTRSLLLAPLALLPFAPAGGQPPPAAPPAGTHQIKLNGHTFTLPVGFTIEVAAGADIVPRPIAAAFDEKGRLYVTDSSGSNEKVADQLAKKPHRVLRLEDRDGDGRYEKSTVYAPNVMLPQGAMWLNGSLYVAAPPHIRKFTDTDDDGRADTDEVWFDGKTLTGCANDLHGPCLGPDGWIYWCKGAFAPQEHKLGDGRTLKTRASHIFRARPDGSGLDVVMTGGMDNPVDLVFTPTGDRIFSCTFLQHPRDGRRDGLIHAVYGGVYGKPHDVLDGHVRTGPDLLPPMTHLGPAAPCGLHRYESDQFGPEYADNLFCCQFNLRKVSRHVLVPAGSTYTTRDSDFLVSDNHDFHPTDVIEDADGSLLVVDTGGWYKLCCPTSQLVKPDVTGAIYRVRKTGAHQVYDPRGLKIDWNTEPGNLEKLAKLLDDPRPAVRERAIQTLGAAGDDALAPLTAIIRRFRPASETARLGAVWAACRSEVADAREIPRLVVKEADRLGANSGRHEPVVRAALHAVGLHRDRKAFSGGQIGFLSRQTDDLHVLRLTAEAISRIGRMDSLRTADLLHALQSERADRTLQHAVTIAVIAAGDPAVLTREAEKGWHPVRAACLTALDQRPDTKVRPKSVLDALDAKNAALSETAWWIAGHHPEWGNRLAEYLDTRFEGIEKLTPPEQDELVRRALPFLKGEPVRGAFGVALGKTTTANGQRPVLRGMARAGLKSFPHEWEYGVTLALCSRSPDVVRDAAAVLRAAPPSDEVAARMLEHVTRERTRQAIPTPPDLDMIIRAATPLGAKLTGARALDAIDHLHILTPDYAAERLKWRRKHPLWAAVLRRKGGTYALIATMPADPTLN